MACMMRVRVSAATGRLPVSALETVPADTLAWRATSIMVTRCVEWVAMDSPPSVDLRAHAKLCQVQSTRCNSAHEVERGRKNTARFCATMNSHPLSPRSKVCQVDNRVTLVI